MASAAPTGRKPVFDGVLLGLVIATGALVVAAWWRGGPALVRSGFGEGTDMLLRSGLLIVVSFWAAGLAQAVLPEHLVSRALGPESGLRGILLATAGGMLTPSGPFVAIPIAAAMGRAGASHAALVAYVSAWGLLAIHRLVAWELPILGPRLALLRWGVSLALPVLAGLAARWLTRS
jgi:uncharacterized membrane protein YraQ (UPF0718 family)